MVTWLFSLTCKRRCFHYTYVCLLANRIESELIVRKSIWIILNIKAVNYTLKM